MKKEGSYFRKKIELTDVIVFVALAAASVFLTFQSDSSPLNAIAHGTDAVVFSYIGWGMSRGAVPYIGLWDNKGPLLYFLEYLGALIHPHYGIFVLELVFVGVTVFLLYRIGRFFAAKWQAGLAALLATAFLAYYFEGGNRVEEFALPFIALAVYLLVRGVRQEYAFGWHQTAVIGAGCGACVLIRLNLAAIILAFCFVIFVALLLKKEWKKALLLLPFFALGMAAIILPFAVYLGLNGALGACLRSAYTVLFSSDNAHGLMTGLNRMIRLASKPALLLFLVMCGFCLYAVYELIRGKEEQRKVIYAGASLAFVVNLFANLVGPIQYPHYYISSIILYVIPLAVILCWAQERLSAWSGRTRLITAILTIVTLLLCLFPARLNAQRILAMRRYPNREVLEAAAEVKRLTGPEDRVIGYGGFPGAASFLKAGERMSGSRFFYSPVWSVFLPEFVEEVQQEIAGDVMSGESQLLILSTRWTPGLYRSQPQLEAYVERHYQRMEQSFTFGEEVFEFYLKK